MWDPNSPVTCPYCAGPLEASHPVSIREFHATLFRCRACLGGATFPRVPEQQLSELYGDHYFANSDWWRRKEELLAHDYLWKVSRYLPADRGARFLEIGPGLGSFLGRLQASGYQELWAVEPSRRAAREIASHAPAAKVVGHAGDLPGSLGFDVVIAFHVIEHLPDPVGWLADLAGRMKPGGLVVALTPNAAAFRPGSLADWGWACPDEHISFLSDRVPDRFFSAHGFTLLVRRSFAPHAIHFPSRLVSLAKRVLRKTGSTRPLPLRVRAIWKIARQFEMERFSPRPNPFLKLEAAISAAVPGRSRDELLLVLRR